MDGAATTNTPTLYTPVAGIRDPEAFKAMMTRLGIDTHLRRLGDSTTVALDRQGMIKLGAWFEEQGDAAQAAAIRRAVEQQS